MNINDFVVITAEHPSGVPAISEEGKLGFIVDRRSEGEDGKVEYEVWTSIYDHRGYIYINSELRPASTDEIVNGFRALYQKYARR